MTEPGLPCATISGIALSSGDFTWMRDWPTMTDGQTARAIAHPASVSSGLPFSTTYVASSAALPLPTFLTAWITPAGTVRASPALNVFGVWPSI
jgi:hypothetical protein